MKPTVAAAIAVAALTLSHAPKSAAQTPDTCSTGAISLVGTVRDTTGATVPGATVTLETGATAATAVDGRFRFHCIPSGTHHLQVTAESFAAASIDTGHTRGDINIALTPQEVQQAVDVGSDDTRGVDNVENTGASRTIQGDSLKALAEDPDDLLRQLQQLTAGNGGDPSKALITVDGFQSTSQLPPKSSIAYIRINPDPFSSEYQEPPYMGGRVEVYTKPGATRYHGALYGAYGGSALNARDPFSTSKGKIGKQRYGADLSGPVRKQGSDFSLSIQHRGIDNVAVVNAVSLDSAGNQVPVNDTVAAPQSQWNGSARLGWQLGPRNTFIANYTAFQNTLSNVGVGGTSLASTGYGDSHYEHILRLTDVTTVSANVMHEARVSVGWSGDIFTPASTAPQIQVAGSFTSGGSNLGAQQQREFLLEVLDDAVITHGKHTVKFGLNLRVAHENLRMTQNFNGTYIFGGGTAPVLDAANQPTTATETISGLEQYRRAQFGLAGGTPTAYTAVTGSPVVQFVQTRGSLFIEDDWKVVPNVKISTGLRYAAQDDPTTLFYLVPRAGIVWGIDKKQTWTVQAHAGMFSSRYSTEDATEFARLGSSARDSFTVYNPIFGSPVGNATTIHTVRTLKPGLGQAYFSEEALGSARSGKNYSAGGDYYFLRIWNEPFTRNINTPLNGNPYGPRPGAANLNILQTQNAAGGTGHAVFAHAEMHGIKPLDLFVGYVDAVIRDLANNDTFDQPQSSTSNAGEYALRSNQNTQTIILNGTLHLPAKVDLSTETTVRSGNRYNVTTGFDNNGDGTFNDRPQYAATGNPNAIATKFGNLVASGGTGVFPRNAGVMPWLAYVDMNASRSFALTSHAKQDTAQTLSVNVRAANVLNHTNVKQVGSVLGSPLFATPYSADNGRRIEAGLRYAF